MCCSGWAEEEGWEKGEEGLMAEILMGKQLTDQVGQTRTGTFEALARSYVDVMLQIERVGARLSHGRGLVLALYDYRATRYCYSEDDSATKVFDKIINDELGAWTSCNDVPRV